MSSRILDRYSSAVHSSDLSVAEGTVYSDSDVLGAAGLAAQQHGLAICLARLFAGDNHAAAQLVRELAEMAWICAQRHQIKLRRLESEDLARAVLAWHRDGACRSCGGHGFSIIPGTRTIGEVECGACRGGGRVPFDRAFGPARLFVARWLLSQIEREQAAAGALAMRKLAPRLEFGP